MVEIETEWNLKLIERMIGHKEKLVEIETEWNLKFEFNGIPVKTPDSRNRNRVEFKGWSCSSCGSCVGGRNRNRVEFKVENIDWYALGQKGRNRNRVEFKGVRDRKMINASK